jgi:hypothetical protein
MRRKGLLGLALLAILALAITATLGATAGASGGHAVVAKKKCKKKKHAASAKKHKKCKKKKNGNGTGTGTTNTPLVRATLTWAATADDPSSDDADMDLFVFDANGHQAGNGSDTIPNSTMSPDVSGKNGTETFTDLAFNLKRPLSFGVCYMVSGSVHTPYTITYVTADGVTHTETRADNNSLTGGKDSFGSSAHANYPGGAPIPEPTYCPGTGTAVP